MKIEIRKAGEHERFTNSFVVTVDGLVHDGMGWDEMLGFIALKTLPPHRRAGESLYPPSEPPPLLKMPPMTIPGELKVFAPDGETVYSEEWLPTGKFRVRAGRFWLRLEQQERRHIITGRGDQREEWSSEFRWRNSHSKTTVMLNSQQEAP